MAADPMLGGESPFLVSTPGAKCFFDPLEAGVEVDWRPEVGLPRLGAPALFFRALDLSREAVCLAIDLQLYPSRG